MKLTKDGSNFNAVVEDDSKLAKELIKIDKGAASARLVMTELGEALAGEKPTEKSEGTIITPDGSTISVTYNPSVTDGEGDVVQNVVEGKFAVSFKDTIGTLQDVFDKCYEDIDA